MAGVTTDVRSTVRGARVPAVAAGAVSVELSGRSGGGQPEGQK